MSLAKSVAANQLNPATEHESEDLGMQVLRHLQSPIWVYDIDCHRIVFANNAALTLWHAESERGLLQRDFSVGMSAAVKKRLAQYQKDFSESSSTFTEVWTFYPDGQPTTAKLSLSGQRLPDGRMAMLCEVPSGLEETPENLRSTEALLHTDVMISLYDSDGKALYMNPAARNAAMGASERLRERFVSREDYDDLWMLQAQNGETRTVRQVHTSAGTAWHDISAKSCVDAVTGDPAVLVTAIDVSELKTARDTARYLAECDKLTGCYNREYFNRRIDELLSKPRNGFLALAMLDVDRFKQINDTFGHEVGDEILKVVTHRILDCISPEETLARFGGDEFLVILGPLANVDAVFERLELLHGAFEKPIKQFSNRHMISASIGATVIRADTQNVDELLREADIALYSAKQAGRDQYLLFNEEMGRAASERRKLEKELECALQKDQFDLFYQPRVDARTGEVVSVEGLVRWTHPERGIVAPGAFIPICEETGMIEELGKIVLEKGCAQVSDWREQGLDLRVSVNVSPRQFLDPSFMQTIEELSGASSFIPGSIEIEITETVLVGNLQEIATRLREMTNLGFKVSIDDFGTGYSNLAYISRFPLDCIKIDRSFVEQLPESKPIVRLIQTLADHIGATTVAEGVETEDQIAHLLEIGCTELQGFYFSKPVPQAEVKACVRRLHSRCVE